MLRVGVRQNQAVEAAERETEQHAAGETTPAHDPVVGEPAHERHQREQVSDGVDADDEHESEHEPADEETPRGRMGSAQFG